MIKISKLTSWLAAVNSSSKAETLSNDTRNLSRTWKIKTTASFTAHQGRVSELMESRAHVQFEFNSLTLNYKTKQYAQLFLMQIS